MNQKLRILLTSILIVYSITLLVSLIVGALYYFHLLSTSLFHITTWILGVCSYLLGGIYIGYNIQKKALFHAFINALFFLAMMLVFGFPTTLLSILELFSKLIAYVVASVVTKNLSS